MKQNNKVTGNKGEQLAADHLENNGYQILERNFRTRLGEIDVIVMDGEILVFVEVKTKMGHDFGEPEEMITKRKLSQVQKMGQIYIEKSDLHKLKWKGACRVDVVAIVLDEDGETERLNHYQGVY